MHSQGQWLMRIDGADQSARRIEDDELTPWMEVAASTRLNAEVLGRLMPPRAGSFLRPTPDDPLKKMAWWCHGYLEAAADHLLLWADYSVPLATRLDTETVQRLRPAFTLARAAIESAAHAIWALGPEEPSECGRRFIQLVIWDLDEQTKAATTTYAHSELSGRREEMLAYFGMTKRSFNPPRYLEMIRWVADFLEHGDSTSPSTAGRFERIWRSTAGAAHGKQWTEFEFNDHVDAGDGLFYSTPRVEAISDVMRVADTFLSAGVVLFAIRTGHGDDFQELWDEAAARLVQHRPT